MPMPLTPCENKKKKKKNPAELSCLCEDQCLGDCAVVTGLTRFLMSGRTGSSPAGSSTDTFPPAVAVHGRKVVLFLCFK